MITELDEMLDFHNARVEAYNRRFDYAIKVYGIIAKAATEIMQAAKELSTPVPIYRKGGPEPKQEAIVVNGEIITISKRPYKFLEESAPINKIDFDSIAKKYGVPSKLITNENSTDHSNHQ